MIGAWLRKRRAERYIAERQERNATLVTRQATEPAGTDEEIFRGFQVVEVDEMARAHALAPQWEIQK